MSIKILQLCLVLISTFKEFVEYSLSSAAQLFKLLLQTKPSHKQTLRQQPFAPIKPTKMTGTKFFDRKLPI